jgi:hypothetical protein
MNTAGFPMPTIKLCLCFHRYLQSLNFRHYKQQLNENQKLATYFALFAS